MNLDPPPQTDDVNDFIWRSWFGNLHAWLLRPRYANIYAHSNTTETAITVTDTYYQVTVFDTNAPSNLLIPDYTNSHITIDKAGDYHVSGVLCLDGVGGVGATYRAAVHTNNGANILKNIHCSSAIDGGTNKEMAMPFDGIATFAKNDTVELWIKNGSGGTENVVVEDVSLVVERIPFQR